MRMSSLFVEMIVTPIYSSTPSTTRLTVLEAVRYVKIEYNAVSKTVNLVVEGELF